MALAPVVRAQEAAGDTAALPPRAGISIQGGIAGLQVDDFNAALRSRGRAELEKQAITLGVESWMRWDRVMLLAAGHNFLPRRSFATNYDTEFEGGYGQIDLGIPLLIKRKTLIYPMAGVGLSRSTVTLRRRGDIAFDSSFNGIPANGGRNVDITGSRFQGHVGLGLDQIFQPQWPNLLLSIGLRVGYMAPFGDTNWRTGPWDVSGAPEIGVRGAYARLTLGGVLGKRRYAAVPMIGSIIPYIGR
jgi:hypothetical protein